MRVILAIFFTVFSLGVAAQTIEISHDAERIKARCEADWGTDYEMINFCVQDAKESFQRFSARIETNEAIYGFYDDSFDMCIRQWGQEWDMVDFCAAEQIAAWERIDLVFHGIPKDIRLVIQSQCYLQWDPDLPMLVFCSEENANAWRRLNGG